MILFFFRSFKAKYSITAKSDDDEIDDVIIDENDAGNKDVIVDGINTILTAILKLKFSSTLSNTATGTGTNTDNTSPAPVSTISASDEIPLSLMKTVHKLINRMRYYLVSDKNSNQRMRACKIIAHILNVTNAMLNNINGNRSAPFLPPPNNSNSKQRSFSVAPILAILIPRCADKNINVRKLASAAITSTLGVYDALYNVNNNNSAVNYSYNYNSGGNSVVPGGGWRRGLLGVLRNERLSALKKMLTCITNCKILTVGDLSVANVGSFYNILLTCVIGDKDSEASLGAAKTLTYVLYENCKHIRPIEIVDYLLPNMLKALKVKSAIINAGNKKNDDGINKLIADTIIEGVQYLASHHFEFVVDALLSTTNTSDENNTIYPLPNEVVQIFIRLSTQHQKNITKTNESMANSLLNYLTNVIMTQPPTNSNGANANDKIVLAMNALSGMMASKNGTTTDDLEQLLCERFVPIFSSLLLGVCGVNYGSNAAALGYQSKEKQNYKNYLLNANNNNGNGDGNGDENGDANIKKEDAIECAVVALENLLKCVDAQPILTAMGEPPVSVRKIVK